MARPMPPRNEVRFVFEAGVSSYLSLEDPNEAAASTKGATFFGDI